MQKTVSRKTTSFPPRLEGRGFAEEFVWEDEITLDATSSSIAAGGEVKNKLMKIRIDINQGP